MVGFWANILTGKSTKYSYLIYRLIYNYQSNGVTLKWIRYIKSIFENCGMLDIWLSNNFVNKTWLTNSVKQRLCDQYVQQWHSDINNSAKGISYRLFNDNFIFQSYLSSNISIKNRIILSKFRCINHKLPIETGRWQNVPKENRICNLCHSDLGDEYHYIMNCNVLSDIRKVYIPSYFILNPNILKYHTLFSTKKLSVLNNLCKFISVINERVSPPG